MIEFSETLLDEDATVCAGVSLGQKLPPSSIVFLEGQLGAGKTTFTRGLLQAFGHSGAVKSPTYTLVEPYEINGSKLYHFDLYRLGDPEELAFMGIRDYFNESAICMIEWPERGKGFLPEPDIKVELHPEVLDTEVLDSEGVKEENHSNIIVRRLRLQAITKKGEEILAK
jgi:tRNA threonylcarbamoyladenosine biosynthesis protein TsaE